MPDLNEKVDKFWQEQTAKRTRADGDDTPLNFFNDMGLTVRELKTFVNTLPDTDQFGEETDVFVSSGNGFSCPAVALFRMNGGLSIRVTPHFCYPEDAQQRE